MVDIRNKQVLFFIVTFFIGVLSVVGQTTIGKRIAEGNDVVLDFGINENRGIILPWVTKDVEVVSPVGGTLIFDSSDKKVKYYKEGADSQWVDLSINSGNVDLGIQQNVNEKSIVDQTIIGSLNSAAVGVLVLEADDKAMVLPKMDSPHLNILSPQAGTMAFDTTSKMLCIFNGSEWSFWKI